MLATVSNALILWTFLASLTFCVVYHILTRWWNNAFGRSLMTYQLGMTFILGISAFQSLTGLGLNLASQIVGLTVFSVVPLALTWRLYVLITASRKAKQEHGPDHSEGTGMGTDRRSPS